LPFGSGTSRLRFIDQAAAWRPGILSLLTAALIVLVGSGSTESRAQGPASDNARQPFVIAKQGSFLVGGTVLTTPGTFDPVNPTSAGQTVHGDHAYVQYQIPVNPRSLPLVT
jgi:hypothetical protein